MKNILQSFVILLTALMVPMTVTAAYVQLADGVYQDGSTLYIGSDVTSLGSLRVNPSVIYCYATIPPSLMNNTFTGYNAEVHVPAAGMVAYFTALYWYNFNNITADAIEPQLVTLSETAVELETDSSVSLTATVAPSNATPSTVSWSSTNTAVATVSGCTVMAVAPGECDIIASCATVQAVCHVVVSAELVTITLVKHEARLLPNHTMTLYATCTPPTTDLVVTTSDPSVAVPRYVNGTIMVVGVGEGTATITVTTADGWANPDACEVTVYTLLGDVNADGFVNVADVTLLTNRVLGDEPDGFNEAKADVNHSGKLDVADVTTLIAYILGNIDLNPPPVPETVTFTVNGVSFTMVAVEGGTFMMGASDDDADAQDIEKPAHPVTLSSFAIGQTEVTQDLWLAVMGSNPSEYRGDLNRPVEKVSWDACQTFIAKLNELTGEQFRLPTNAEWEFAARGGNQSMGYKYSGSNDVDEVAWYYDNSFYDGTHAVATKSPNELGLYDMSGNVCEWVNDWYGNYSSEAQTNPTGPAYGTYRVFRNGSCAFDARACRVTCLTGCKPYGSFDFLGLRLAL